MNAIPDNFIVSPKLSCFPRISVSPILQVGQRTGNKATKSLERPNA